MGVQTDQKTVPPSVLLLVMTLILGISRTGFFVTPGTRGVLTVMHIPTILAGILDGPVGGMAVGAAFGVFAEIDLEPHDWLVQLPPRMAIGLVAALVFLLVRRRVQGGARTSLAAVLGAACGSLTNTLGVAALLVARGYYPLRQVVAGALLHGGIELVMAVVVTLPVAVWAWHGQASSGSG